MRYLILLLLLPFIALGQGSPEGNSFRYKSNTTAQRDAFGVYSDGARLVYNSTTGQFEYKVGAGSWTALGGGGSSADWSTFPALQNTDMADFWLFDLGQLRFTDTDGDTGIWSIDEITNASYVGDLGIGHLGVYRAMFPQSGVATEDDHVLTKGDGDALYGTGSGDVVGPVSSTDNAIPLFDGTTGKLIKNNEDLTYDGNNFELFNGTDVGNEDPSRSLYLYRRAPEGNSNFRIFITNNNSEVNFSTTVPNLRFNSVGGNVFYQSILNPLESIYLGRFEGLNERQFRHYGAAGGVEKYVQFQLTDSDDYYNLTRQDASVLGFKVNMPLEVTGDLTAGNVVYNNISGRTGTPLRAIQIETQAQIDANPALGNDESVLCSNCAPLTDSAGAAIDFSDGKLIYDDRLADAATITFSNLTVDTELQVGAYVKVYFKRPTEPAYAGAVVNQVSSLGTFPADKECYGFYAIDPDGEIEKFFVQIEP